MLSKRVEYGLIVTLVTFVRVLPLGVARTLADGLAWVLRDLVGIRRSVVRDNLERAFPDRTGDEINDLSTGTYRFFVRAAVDWVKCDAVFEHDRLEWEGREILDTRRGDGVIMVTGHIGLWEMSAAMISRRYGPITVYADEQSNPYSQQLIEDWRARYGVTGVSGVNGLRRLVQQLGDGRFVGLLGDQRPRNRYDHVPFFGARVRNTRIPAFLARRTGCPVVPMVAFRTGPRSVRLEIDDPLPLSLDGVTEDNGSRLLNQYNRWLERKIRRRPEQYFWFHKRWKGSLPLEETDDETPSSASVGEGVG